MFYSFVLYWYTDLLKMFSVAEKQGPLRRLTVKSVQKRAKDIKLQMTE